MLFLLPLLAAVQAAPAAPPGAGQPPAGHFFAEPVAVMIAGFDANGDAQVNRAELDTGAAASFGPREEMGLIELSQWSVRWLGHLGARPGRFDFDSDGDDRVTRAEFAAEMARQFDRLDLDRSGVLVRSELIRIDTSRMPTGPAARGRRNRIRG